MDKNELSKLLKKYHEYFSYMCPEDDSKLTSLSLAPYYISKGKNLRCPKCHRMYFFNEANILFDREKAHTRLEQIFKEEDELVDLIGNKALPSA
ncbi:hypothetical protein J4474_01755 [Candidatus Pacearchaeota archaeon]|nr:hypothetical protein [Candidatus Pacearchaeota archaeon]